MKTIMLCLLLSSFIPSHLIASSASSDEEIVLKKTLEALNEGRMFPSRDSLGKGLKQVQRKEEELVQGFIEVASKPADEDARENLDKKHSEYCMLLAVDFEVMPQMCVYRLLLENKLLTRQMQRLQSGAK